jgi:hypothetical protein
VGGAVADGSRSGVLLTRTARARFCSAFAHVWLVPDEWSCLEPRVERRTYDRTMSAADLDPIDERSRPLAEAMGRAALGAAALDASCRWRSHNDALRAKV